MLSFLNSAPRPIYYSSPVYADSLYRPYLSYPSLVADPEVRYRRALSEYFAAEEEYNAVLRAREEARISAYAEDLRRERARLLRAQIARARQEQQARQLEQALAEVLSRAVAVPEGAHDYLPPLRVRDVIPRSLSDTAVPRLRAHHQSQKEESLVSSCDCAPRSSEQQKCQPDNGDEAKANVNPYRHLSQSDERSAPNLESLLRSRLQKIVGDEEVQDVARAILRRLTPTTGGTRPPAPASSPEKNTSTQPLEGADLSRSDALQGLAAEAAKESFKAHRAEAAESDEPAPSHTFEAAPSPFTIIQDIRSALEKLSSDFSLPSSLDFADDEADGLAYTPTNAPIRVYEHALDGLLEQLDAIESDGDEEVRVERRAVVKEVEKAIEDVERKVRKAREGAKRDSQTGRKTVPAEADLTTDKVSQAAETESDGLSGTSPDDRLDPASVRLPNLDISLPITVTDSESILVAREDVKDEFSLESVPQAVKDFAATPAATDGAEPSQFSTDDALEFELDALPEQGTSDETLATPSASSAFAIRVEPSPVVSPIHPILGAIPPSSTPVSPTLSSSEISEGDLASLGHERFIASLERLGGDVDDDDANGDEHEWIDIKA